MASAPLGQNAENGTPEPLVWHHFPSKDYPREIHWKPRRDAILGKIVVGGEVVDNSRLNEQGQEKVPAGKIPEAYQMEVWLTNS